MVGPLPYSRIAVVANDTVTYPPHAVESIVMLYRRDIFSSREEMYSLLIHEIGHLWWGNLIIGMDNTYITEGLVQFFSLLFFEDKYGKESGRRMLKRYLEVFTNYPESWSVRSAIALNMLRHIVGKENLYKLVRRLFEEYRFSYVTNEGFRKIAEDVSGKDLSWFFEGFYPGEFKYDLTLKGIKTSVKDGLYHTEFTIYESYGRIKNPLEIEVLIRTEKERIIKKVNNINNKGKKIELDTDSMVLSITIDPDMKLMDWDRSNNSTVMDIVDFQWHPQGKGIFYLSNDNTLSYLDGAEIKKIVSQNASPKAVLMGYKSSFALSSEGDRVAYIISNGDESLEGNELWMADIYANKKIKLAGGKTNKIAPQWVKGKEEIIFELRERKEEYSSQKSIWRWRKEKGIVPLFNGDEDKEFWSPVPSPNGRNLLFTIFVDNHFEIWLCDIEGKNQKRLPGRYEGIGVPVWYSDGTKIAVAILNSGNTNIYITDIDNEKQNLQQVTKSNRSRDPVWSADGNSIFFTSDRNGNKDIYKVSLDGKETQLTNDPADEHFPRCNSATGQIAYIYEGNETAELWVMDSDGKNKHPLPLYNIISYQ